MSSAMKKSFIPNNNQSGGKLTPSSTYGSSSTTNAANAEKPRVFFPMMVSTLKKIAEPVEEQYLRFGENRIEKVLLIGRIAAFDNGKTKLTIELDDCTGILPIVIHKLPMEELPDIMKGISLQPNVYIRIFCTMKVSAEKIFIGDQVSQIKDHNLITNHIYSCLHALVSSTHDIDIEQEMREVTEEEVA